MKSNPNTLVKALQILSRDIHCEDGVATAVIAEAADVIERGLLTDAEREAVQECLAFAFPATHPMAATLRGLLERTAVSDFPPPSWLARPYWVDPPSGHRYGFPKLYDPAKDGDITAWMVANGYPRHLAEQNLTCTFTADSQ